MNTSPSFGKRPKFELAEVTKAAEPATKPPLSIKYSVKEGPSDCSAQFTDEHLKTLGWTRASGYVAFLWMLPSSNELSCRISKQEYFIDKDGNIPGGQLVPYKEGVKVDKLDLDIQVFPTIESLKKAVEEAFNIQERNPAS